MTSKEYYIKMKNKIALAKKDDVMAFLALRRFIDTVKKQFPEIAHKNKNVPDHRLILVAEEILALMFSGYENNN